MISFEQSGDFSNTERFLKNVQRVDPRTILDAFGRKGVAALANATPTESGASAAAWGYRITKSSSAWTIEWINTNVDATGTPIVVLIQHGHGTGTGGFVQGRDFINPVMRPIFDQIADEAWKAVKSA